MTFVLPSDADPGQVPPTPVPSSPPDFLAQLTAAQQADARLNSRGHELTDQEFLGGGQPNRSRGATPIFSMCRTPISKPSRHRDHPGQPVSGLPRRWCIGGLTRRWRGSRVCLAWALDWR